MDRTYKVGLIGSGIGESLSPALHEREASRLGLDYTYRLFDLDELEGIALHPPIGRFLRRFQPGDPCVYLGALWAP